MQWPAWGQAAAKQGAFDDGPISLASTGVEFSGTRAQFRVDARLLGQDTLNWLALAILDFGEAVHTVIGIYFGSTIEFIDAMIGPCRGTLEVVEFPKDRSSAIPPMPIAATSVNHVPPDARPAVGFLSRRFPVLALPIDEWDSFVGTIYFAMSPWEEERERLVALLDAWLLLGSYGGLDRLFVFDSPRG
ncbi:hypothetical protein SAMN05444166_8494 [Singulisphaera sp. GP187]|uniref:hypothetical protein n=1 Tax=Singulisphaera sp. GP187 TaxID=1882752 RepID=UPI0009298150|nr:hypothetical protein [Singulisphaera sp. GP187]SIO68002.1 hypothetical protein SAMN05444166_8494 [Singulisphaera sp. GP187]